MRLASDPTGRNFMRDISVRRLALAALVSATIVAAPAWSQPHSVSGVNANDVLNIRADIDYTLNVAEAEVIGAIPHDATDVMVTGVSVDIGGATWREIVYKGTVGWVNARFLKPTNLLLQTPEALDCAGTEPFWTVTVEDSGGTFMSPDLESPVALDYLRFAPGIGRTDLWGHYLGSADGAYSLTVLVRYTEACFDGMSDLTYDFEALLLGLGASGAPAYGCCSIKF